jgi:lantibiotic modifying enzyme
MPKILYGLTSKALFLLYLKEIFKILDLMLNIPYYCRMLNIVQVNLVLCRGFRGGASKSKSWVAAFTLNDGSDDFTVRYRKLSNAFTDNRLTCNNSVVRPEDYESDILRGFNDVMQLIVDQPLELWSFLDNIFRADDFKIRIIFRATVFYAIIKCRSYQPQEILSGKYWENTYQYLLDKNNFIMDISTEFRTFIAKSEIFDLQKGYIPIFFRDLHTKRLYNSQGEFIENYFESDVSSYFNNFINNLSNSFVDHNVAAIKRCLASTRAFDFNADISNWIA